MIAFIKRYPVSILVIAVILFLSFFNPPQTEVSNIPNIDKLVHVCMYGGLTFMLWLEHLRAHNSIIKRHIIIGGILCPIALGGVIEIGQATLTTNRSGDWFDFMANTTSVILGSLFSYYVVRPLILKKKKLHS